ncbi:hypothetical protein Patl1_32583 [Pistacia atlantica]|uniref:Uncharacterized protein n=1 Tax=Pistacia atlantica TaxID=434234 RepID=A0ACC1AMB2_9ROSI|nr:hypothetical protein Patl1_32583 [Pistacia atlantica]
MTILFTVVTSPSVAAPSSFASLPTAVALASTTVQFAPGLYSTVRFWKPMHP